MPRWEARVPASDPPTPPHVRRSGGVEAGAALAAPRLLREIADADAALEGERPGLRSFHAAHDAEERRLPRAVDADEPHLLAFVHGERHAVEDHAGTVGLVEILDIEDVHGSIGFRSALAGIVGGGDTPDRAGSARGGSGRSASHGRSRFASACLRSFAAHGQIADRYRSRPPALSPQSIPTTPPPRRARTTSVRAARRARRR